MGLCRCLEYSMILPDMLTKAEEREKGLSLFIFNLGTLTFLTFLISKRTQGKSKTELEICSMAFGFQISL